jgi:hypothetical protein
MFLCEVGTVDSWLPFAAAYSKAHDTIKAAAITFIFFIVLFFG